MHDYGKLSIILVRNECKSMLRVKTKVNFNCRTVGPLGFSHAIKTTKKKIWKKSQFCGEISVRFTRTKSTTLVWRNG
jgi:hypothetical protein